MSAGSYSAYGARGAGPAGGGAPDLKNLLDDIRKFTYGTDSPQKPLDQGKRPDYSSPYGGGGAADSSFPPSRTADQGIQDILSRISNITNRTTTTTTTSTVTSSSALASTNGASSSPTAYSPTGDGKGISARERYEAELARLDAEIDRYRPGGGGGMQFSSPEQAPAPQGVPLSASAAVAPSDFKSPYPSQPEGYMPSPVTLEFSRKLRGTSAPAESRANPHMGSSPGGDGLSDIERIRMRHQQWKGGAREIPPVPAIIHSPPPPAGLGFSGDEASKRSPGLPPTHPRGGGDPYQQAQALLRPSAAGDYRSYSNAPSGAPSRATSSERGGGFPSISMGSSFDRGYTPGGGRSGSMPPSRGGGDMTPKQPREQLILEILRRCPDTNRRQPLIKAVHDGVIRSFNDLNQHIDATGARAAPPQFQPPRHGSMPPPHIRQGSAQPMVIPTGVGGVGGHMQQRGSSGPMQQRPPQHPPAHGQPMQGQPIQRMNGDQMSWSMDSRGRAPSPMGRTGSQPPPSYRSPSPQMRHPEGSGRGGADSPQYSVGSYQNSIPPSPQGGVYYQQQQPQQQQQQQQQPQQQQQQQQPQHYSREQPQQYSRGRQGMPAYREQQFAQAPAPMQQQQQQSRGRSGYSEFHQQSTTVYSRSPNEGQQQGQPIVQSSQLGDNTIQHMLNQGYMEGAML